MDGNGECLAALAKDVMRSPDVLERPASLTRSLPVTERPYSLRVVRGKRAEAGAPFVVTEASQASLHSPLNVTGKSPRLTRVHGFKQGEATEVAPCHRLRTCSSVRSGL